MGGALRRLWRRFFHPEWTYARLTAAKSAAYKVASAEGSRSNIAIKALGREEYRRQVDALVAAIKKQNGAPVDATIKAFKERLRRPCENCGLSIWGIHHLPIPDEPGVCWLEFALGAAERSDRP